MDVREKLVELIKDGIRKGLRARGDELLDYSFEDVADRLISNGVTVQEWISVNDKLPKDDSDVLAYSRNGKEGRIYPANYAKGVWFDCIFNTPVTYTTTHWMPIPEPPKGE